MPSRGKVVEDGGGRLRDRGNVSWKNWSRLKKIVLFHYYISSSCAATRSAREPTHGLPYRLVVNIFAHRGRCGQEGLSPITEQLDWKGKEIENKPNKTMWRKSMQEGTLEIIYFSGCQICCVTLSNTNCVNQAMRVEYLNF